MERLGALKAECAEKLATAKEVIETKAKEMDELKAALYARFGNLINLDE